jgi:PAS domain-containing protein
MSSIGIYPGGWELIGADRLMPEFHKLRDFQLGRAVAAPPNTFGEMNDSEDRYRTMIDAIPAMAWSCLPDGSLEFLNQRWLECTGLSLDEALG